MKFICKIIPVVLILFFGLQNPLKATVYRVNNTPGVDADYSSFALAHNAASGGDTIYLGGSASSYGIDNITKKLIIIGPGFNHTTNDSTQASSFVASFDRLSFSTGSDGSILKGVEIDNNTIYALSIGADDITVKGCFLRQRDNYENVLEIVASVDNTTLIGNVIWASYSGTYYQYALDIGSNVTNLYVSNNIIIRGYSSITSGYDDDAINMATTASGTFSNNVIAGEARIYNSTVQNNIHTYGSYYSSASYPNTYSNNISHSTSMGASGSLANVSMSSGVFTMSGDITSGKYYELAVGSVAIGAGVNGDDCGIFGGATPFVLSGMPNIPSVYEAIVPTSGTSAAGLQVTIKAKTHQ